jgi:DNA-binding LacI/PurR family transcriptional regulator
MDGITKNNMKSRQVTIKDIARILNVSPSTVSRALQDNPDISADTKKTVSELAQKLKYQPNVVALSLKKHRSLAIGVIIPEIVHYFFSQVISGIEDVAYRAGFTVIICQSSEKYDREVNNARTLIAHQVEGILVSVSKETADFQHLDDILAHDIPLVFFDRVAPGIPADQIINNDREAACQATRHLIDQGRKRIAHFAGPQNLIIGRERKEGYLKALADAGLPVDPGFCTETDSFDKAFSEVIKMKKSENMPDAIFCNNDLTAIGAMKSLLKLGFRIPDDVAVVGFSDGIFAEITNPLLSSVDQHGYEMGTIAAQMLLKRIGAGETFFPYETRILKADLVVRESSVIK